MCTVIYVFYILKVVDIVTTVLPADLHKKKSCKETEKYTPFKGAAPERAQTKQAIWSPLQLCEF